MSEYSAAFAKCPFYGKDDRSRIYCNEGVWNDSFMHMIFLYPAKKSSYKRKYCDNIYEQCPIYSALLLKYEDK
ncbi:MAG: hypothetical protein IJF13_03775 [Clostridia bacterium]|nr:hypothetical protein [Clostridia bacterium]